MKTRRATYRDTVAHNVIYDGQRIENVIRHLVQRIEALEDVVAEYGLLMHEEDSDG